MNYLSPRIFNGPCFKNYTQWQFLDLKKQTYFNFLVFVIAANKVRQKVFKYKISLHFRKNKDKYFPQKCGINYYDQEMSRFHKAFYVTTANNFVIIWVQGTKKLDHSPALKDRRNAA